MLFWNNCFKNTHTLKVQLFSKCCRNQIFPMGGTLWVSVEFRLITQWIFFKNSKKSSISIGSTLWIFFKNSQKSAIFFIVNIWDRILRFLSFWKKLSFVWAFFSMTGDCDVEDDCVSSSNYPGQHANSESCSITMLQDAEVRAGEIFSLENCCGKSQLSSCS